MIDRKEASELFTNVQRPTIEENDFCCAFWYSSGEQSGHRPTYIRSSDGQEYDGTTEITDHTEAEPEVNSTASATANGPGK